MDQIGLFGAAPPPVGPAPVDDETLALAARLPTALRLGTSSWTFPGWHGLVYDREASSKVLGQHGLAAYGQHPLLRTVGVDRTFYKPEPESLYRRYADAVPTGFRFLVKASEDCTLARFPDIARYGKRAGEKNERFLDAAWATDQVVGPWAAGLRDKAGPLLFQLPPQNPAEFGGPQRFAEKVHRFLEDLPAPPLMGFYALEVRNPELLTPALGAALRLHDAVPALVLHPRMPDLRTQWARVRMAKDGPVVVRWMLQRGLDYETARKRFTPFRSLAAPDLGIRQTLARLAKAMDEAQRPTWIIINNKAEGSSPLSVRSLAEAIVT